jgi:hypothetical protein
VSCRRVDVRMDCSLLRMVVELSFQFLNPFHLDRHHAASVAASCLLLALVGEIHDREPWELENAVVECPCAVAMGVLNVEVFDAVKVVEFQYTRFVDQIQSNRHSSVVDDHHPCEEGIEVFHVVVECATIDGNPIRLFLYRPSHPSLHLLYSESLLDHDVHMVQPECIGIGLLSYHCLRIRIISYFRRRQ